MNPLRILFGYRLLFCALIIIASAQAFTDAGPAEHHVLPLAAAEIGGALLLAWRRTQWVGAATLLAVFAGAQLVSAIGGVWPTRFLQYAASAVLIVLLDRALRSGRSSDLPSGQAGSA